METRRWAGPDGGSGTSWHVLPAASTTALCAARATASPPRRASGKDATTMIGDEFASKQLSRRSATVVYLVIDHLGVLSFLVRCPSFTSH